MVLLSSLRLKTIDIALGSGRAPRVPKVVATSESRPAR
jgi:hypothetical protein